ncbi:MAG: succinate dehydrogenase [Gammaproteobacteria bacterium]|nr:MAG: succinate dehydrogenase [Gammaproteobacteria bacterium]
MNQGRSDRRHAGYAAFVIHRLSGVLLALFLPLHFLALGLALDGARALDEFLVFAELPWVKVSEWGLVVLLSVHLTFGLRVLVLEFLPWRGVRKGWIGWGAGVAVAAGLLFIVGVG